MIENLRLRNFKSIIEADVKLSDLTVLVGANGSGKSNLVQAMAFLGAIPRVGVAGAVNRFGGFSGMVPKAIPSTDVKTTTISIHHRALLPPLPEEFRGDLLPVRVDYDLELAYSRHEIVRVAAERMVFHEPLGLADALAPHTDEALMDTVLSTSPSQFLLQRGPRGGVSYSAHPPFTKESLSVYLDWLGLPFLKEGVKSPTRLDNVLMSIRRSVGQGETKLRRDQSFLDPDSPSMVGLAEQFRVFRTLTSQIKAYDLLLNQLRHEQDVSDSRLLSSAGLNMPSVIRYLRPNESSWNRILTTLGAIAPHVKSMRPSTLRTGKEFVEFVETTARRPVESWESSDGTLRALAILLALETHRDFSTILIEEPEQNLHPWAIRAIVEHIREVIVERNVQVILTTHSPHVLEKLYPAEVLVTSRTDEGGTEFRTLEEILPHTRRVMGEVAELWVKGLLGGVPSDA